MNNVMSGQVSVIPGDVEFLNSPTTGEPNRVKVSVRRTASRGNPVATMIARYFGMANTDIGAIATAEASPANAMDCVKPFTIPDKWIEKQTPPWDPDNDTYDAFNNKGVPLANPDVYIPPYNASGAPDPNYTGYRMFPAYPGGPTDVGTMLTIRASTGTNIAPSMYFSLAMTADTGGSDYRWNIANCNHTHYYSGDLEVLEPGAMAGPTSQGIEELIAKDAGARYNPGTQKVDSPYGNHSPRVFPIPLYDPIYYDEGKRNGRTATLKTVNWICFFADSVVGNDVKGIIVPCTGIYDKNGPAPNSALPKTIRLVQ